MNLRSTTAARMRQRFAGAAGVALGGWACLLAGQEPAAPAAADTNAVVNAAPSTSRRDYQHFVSINDRNIFNPNRTRRSRYNATEEKPPEPRIEVVALTGTLSYAQGPVAFFDSTTGAFRKAARAGEEIAGYTVKEIAPAVVSLERASQLVQLKVGQQLRRQDDGPWEVTTGEPISNSAGAAPSGRSSRRDGNERRSERSAGGGETTASAGSTSPSSEGPSDALKRLLEQRRKEQSQ